MALRIAGRAFAARTDAGRALEAFASSLAGFTKIGDPTGVALTLRDQAIVQRLAGHHDMADRDHRSARSLLAQLGLRRLAHESTSEFCSRSR